MAIRGSLSEAALSDVIQLLSFSMKSGCLSVTDGRNFGNIFINQGRIVYATLLNRNVRLGDILLNKGLITREALDQALQLQKQRKTRLGEVLVELGALSNDALLAELKEQITETIFTMLMWETGYFNFESDLLPSEEEITVQISPQEILLEGARRVDEWRKIENKLPPFETVLVPRSGAVTLPLTNQETRIIGLVDGSRSIDEILKLSEFDFFETCRTIYGLLSAGLLDKPEKPLVTKKTAGDITEYKNLGYAFFKTEMLDEAEREFRKVLEFDPKNAEALLYCGLIEIHRQRYDAAVERLLMAAQSEKHASVLINLGYAYIKLGRPTDALGHLEKALKISPGNPRALCNLGIAYYELKDYDRALEVFSDKRLPPEFMTPFVYIPLIHLQRDKIEEAVDCLVRAIDRFPRLGSAKNNMAVIQESLGCPEEAERLYRQALEENPHDLRICRNLADFYYEAQILGAARELYERIPEGQRNWEVLFKLGNIMLRQGDTDSALTCWQKAHELSPEQEIVGKNIEILKKTRG